MKTPPLKMTCLSLAVLASGMATSHARFTSVGSARINDMRQFQHNGVVQFAPLHIHPNGYDGLNAAEMRAVASTRQNFTWETDQDTSYQARIFWEAKNSKPSTSPWFLVHGFCTLRESSAATPPATLTANYRPAYGAAHQNQLTVGWTVWKQRASFSWGSYTNWNAGVNMDAPARFWFHESNPWLSRNNAQCRDLMRGVLNNCNQPIRSVTLNTNDMPGIQEGDTHQAAISMLQAGSPVSHFVVQNFSGADCNTNRLGNATRALQGL